MPSISMFYGMVIMMFYDEHNPPHFHVRYNEFKASIRIADLALMNGYLPPKALGLVMEWASQHFEELNDNWNLAAKGEILNNIRPL